MLPEKPPLRWFSHLKPSFLGIIRGQRELPSRKPQFDKPSAAVDCVHTDPLLLSSAATLSQGGAVGPNDDGRAVSHKGTRTCVTWKHQRPSSKFGPTSPPARKESSSSTTDSFEPGAGCRLCRRGFRGRRFRAVLDTHTLAAKAGSMRVDKRGFVCQD